MTMLSSTWHTGIALLALALLGTSVLYAQENTERPIRRHHIGSSAFVSFTFLLEESPDFYQLNYGYRLTERDVLSIEAITWKYWAPIGIPYGPSKDDSEEEYPGYVQAFGVGAAYQRFVWRDIYVAAHALPLVQHYIDEADARIQSGFQLFLTGRLGYYIGFFNDRFFLEPSIAFTYWPINTNLPKSFAAQENKWPNYFLFEPGLHFGVRF
ncbi:MAG: hypothetical protein RhofKO_43540 [Rhodothermales bacterium]